MVAVARVPALHVPVALVVPVAAPDLALRDRAAPVVPAAADPGPVTARAPVAVAIPMAGAMAAADVVAEAAHTAGAMAGRRPPCARRRSPSSQAARSRSRSK